MRVPARALGDELDELEIRGEPLDPGLRVVGGAEVRPGDAVPADDELAGEEALPLLLGEAIEVAAPVRGEEDEAAGPDDAAELLHPGVLQPLRKVGEDRERVHEVELLVLERERRLELVARAAARTGGSRGPRDEALVVVGAPDLRPVEVRPLAQHPPAAAAEVEDRAHPLELDARLAERAADRARGERAALEEPLRLRRPATRTISFVGGSGSPSGAMRSLARARARARCGAPRRRATPAAAGVRRSSSRRSVRVTERNAIERRYSGAQEPASGSTPGIEREQLRELARLLVAQALAEQGVDAGDVRARGLAELLRGRRRSARRT